MTNPSYLPFQQIPLPLMLVNSDFIVQFNNDALNVLLEDDSNEMLQHYLFDYFTPLHENVEAEHKAIQAMKPSSAFDSYCYIFEKEEVYRLHITQKNSDNRYWVTLFKEKNWYDCYQKSENALRHLRKTIRSANIGIWECDFVTNEAFFSDQFKKIINIPIETALTWQGFVDLINEDDKEIFTAFFNMHHTSHIPLDFEFRMLIDSDIRWFNIKGETFEDNEEHYTILGTLTDCTQAKDILTELNSVIESNNIAMEAGKIGTWQAELNNQGKWKWSWDILANQMFGLHTNDIGNLDKWIACLHHEDRDRVSTALQVSLQTGEEFSENYRAVLPSKEVRYFVSRGKGRKNSLGEVYRIDGIYVDETLVQVTQKELKQLNYELEDRVNTRTAELVEAKEKAEKASVIKTQFLSMMSHELRTPMNAVIGSLDLLQSTQQNYECQDLIDTAKTSAENLVFILNDVLDINKIEAGKLAIEDLTFSISEVVDNVIQVFIPVALKKHIILEVVEDPNAPSFVKGDEIRVRQILFNLIGNALKFTSTTKEKIGHVRLQVDQLERNEFVSNISFKVIDNGIGIDKSKHESLFNPFTQAELSTTRKYGGTGLGLTICSKLSEMMGGKIHLESELDKGSTFEADIPFWMSQETHAMNIIELASVGIDLFNFNRPISEVIKRIEQHLTKAGAEVSINSKMASDVVFIFADDLSQDMTEVEAALAKESNVKKMILGVKCLDLEKAKKVFKNVKVVNVDSLTRIQLIQLVEKTKQRSLELDLDDLDLGLDLDLDLDLELPNLEPSDSDNPLNKGILLVEDNDLNQKLIAKQLKNLGYACDVANDGIEGKNKWQEGDYKLILTDCHMPHMDGYEMAQSIRKIESVQEKRPVPIVAVTGAAMSGDSQHCYDAGMNDFVSKPIKQSDLKKVLDKWYSNE